MNINSLKAEVRVKFLISIVLYSFALISPQSTLAGTAEVFVCKVKKYSSTTSGFSGSHDTDFKVDCLSEPDNMYCSENFDKGSMQHSSTSFYVEGKKPSSSCPRGTRCEDELSVQISNINGDFYKRLTTNFYPHDGSSSWSTTEVSNGNCELKKFATKFE